MSCYLWDLCVQVRITKRDGISKMIQVKAQIGSQSTEGLRIEIQYSTYHRCVSRLHCVSLNVLTQNECRGSRVFQEIAAVLAKGVMTVPLTMGFEIGSGFTGTFMTGTEYIDDSGQSSGIQGGIIKMRIAVKPRFPTSFRSTERPLREASSIVSCPQILQTQSTYST